MAKIKIQFLCKKIKSDVDEKGLFFKELTAKEFLVPFCKENIFNFTDNASYWVVQYLQKIYADDTKDIIVEIVNNNIENTDINNIAYSTYIQIIQLLGLFDIETLNKVKLIKLLKHKYSMDFILSLYKNSQIYKNKDLVKASIISLLRYKVYESYKKICKIDYESYQLSKLLSSKETKENFEMALKQDFLFKLLIEKYKEVYNKVHEKKNDILDVFSRQIIDPEEIRKNLVNDYHIEDISDVILYFISINLSSENIHVTENIKQLLSHRIYMLRKLGLYLITSDMQKNIGLLETFFNNINKTNVLKVTNICLYEIISIFQKISDIKPDSISNSQKCKYNDYIDKYIENYLQLFSKKQEEVKYRVLHGLKHHPKFKNQFYELKNKYQYEKETPGIYWSSGVGGWVKNVSPISENDFRIKSIKEQIEYLNSDIKYNRQLIQIDKESVEQVNERGLAELFKKVLTEDINKYLNDDSIFMLKNEVFIGTFLEVLSSKIEQIDSINRVVLFFDNIFDVIIQNKNEYNNLLCQILDFNIGVSEKRHKDFKKIFKYVKYIAENDYNENYYNNKTDLDFKVLNTIHGRNFRCYMNHITKIRKINENDFDFLSYILKKDNEDKFCCFYYYLGMQYEYLSYHFKELNLLEKVYNLDKKARIYFINGYLSYFCYIKPFEELKPLILEAFENNEINNERVRTRFVMMLLDLKLRFDMDEVFKEFNVHFTEEDYSNTLRNLTYNRNKKYAKSKIINYWCEIIARNNKEYTSSLLSIFNKYCDIDDIGKYENELIQVIKNGFPDSLVANRSISDFLDKLLLYFKTKQNGVVTFNILTEIITSMQSVKYIYNELDTIKDLLNEFKIQGKENNAQLIAEKIHSTSSIKSYSTNLKEFLV